MKRKDKESLREKRQHEEGDRKRAHISELTQQLHERNNQRNEAQAQKQYLKQHLQALQVQQHQAAQQVLPEAAQSVDPQVAPQGAPPVAVQRDFTAEFIAMVGNVQLNQLDVNVLTFSDKNSSNPLKFLDEVERYSKMRQMQMDRKFGWTCRMIFRIMINSKMYSLTDFTR